MFITRIIYFCLLASIFICSNALSAEKKTGKADSNFQLHGQVFIVTKGQQTFKLPLVQVFAIPEAIISKVIASRVADRNEIRRKLTPQLIEKKQAVDQAIAEQQPKNDAVRTLISQKKGLLESCPKDNRVEFDNCMKAYAELESRCDEAIEAQKPYFNRKVAAWSEYEAVDVAYKNQRDAFKFFDGIESDIATSSKIVKTDADGNFSLADMKGKRIALFARAKRQVIGETEDYIWLIWADKTNSNIMLSNDNLIDSKCSECISFLDGIE